MATQKVRWLCLGRVHGGPRGAWLEVRPGYESHVDEEVLHNQVPKAQYELVGAKAAPEDAPRSAPEPAPVAAEPQAEKAQEKADKIVDKLFARAPRKKGKRKIAKSKSKSKE
jgi:hypothetical protein